MFPVKDLKSHNDQCQYNNQNIFSNIALDQSLEVQVGTTVGANGFSIGTFDTGNVQQYLYVTETVQTQENDNNVLVYPELPEISPESSQLDLELDLQNNPSSIKCITNNAVQYCKEQNISNPVEILRYVQTVLHSGT